MNTRVNLAGRAILFDFDGVLARTMEDNYRAWFRAFAKVGIHLDETEYYLLEGLSTRRLAEAILKKNAHELSRAEELANLKEAHYLAENHFALYPGALELARQLAKHSLLGLVTGAGSERLSRTAPAELLDCFSALVTGDLIRSPKPAPEPYLTAAAMLGVLPEDCLVVENAPLGIQAAKAAGMACVAIRSTLSPDHLRQADLIVADIPALAKFFQTNISK